MSTFWFCFNLVLIQLVCLFFGIRASRKNRSQSDYYLAGKRLSVFPLMMTFVATQVGGGLILGVAEEAYRMGWKIVFYPLGAITGLLLLGSTVGLKLAELPVSTVAQIFEVIYGSKFLKKVASALSMFTLFMATVAQILASQKLFLSCNLDSPFWFIIFWSVIFIYTMYGGLEGIVGIDVIQGSYFIVILGIGAVFLFLTQGFTVDMLTPTSIVNEQEGTQFLGWFLMPCLFMLIEQDMAQRCFSARSSSTVRKAAFGSAFLIFLVSLIPILFGLMGVSKGVSIPEGRSVLLNIAQVMLPPWLSAAIACAVLMAIVSTAISLIHSISSNLGQDFELQQSNQTSKLRIAKIFTFGIGFLALLSSYFFNQIVSVLIQSYELIVVCLFVPVFMSLFWPTRNKMAAWLSILLGATGFTLSRMTAIPFPKELFELGLSFTGFIIGTLFYRVEQYEEDQGSNSPRITKDSRQTVF